MSAGGALQSAAPGLSCPEHQKGLDFRPQTSKTSKTSNMEVLEVWTSMLEVLKVWTSMLEVLKVLKVWTSCWRS